MRIYIHLAPCLCIHKALMKDLALHSDMFIMVFSVMKNKESLEIE